MNAPARPDLRFTHTTRRGVAPNIAEGRWRWWYDAIVDYMIQHPEGSIKDCAARLQKNPTTISMIVNTDMFKEFLARRKAEWREQHDFNLVRKMTAVAEKSLDLVLDRMERKGDQIPMNIAADVMTSTLDRLGYGPKAAPAVAVNVQQNDNRTVVMAAVSPAALEEAREALRVAQSNRGAIESEVLPPISSRPATLDGTGLGAAEPQELLEEDEAGAPLTISSQ